MLAKLSADILDKLDIFILDIEELRIPQVRIPVFSFISLAVTSVLITAAMVGVHMVHKSVNLISGTRRCAKEQRKTHETVLIWADTIRIPTVNLRFSILLPRRLGIFERGP